MAQLLRFKGKHSKTSGFSRIA